MSYGVGMFILGLASGQFALVVVALLLHRSRERRENELRARFHTPVVRAWPPRWDTTRETIQ